MTALADYEGQPVAETAIRITKAGDGLSEGLSVEPAEYHIGDEVCIVLRTTCSKVIYEEVPKGDGELRRVHTLATTKGYVVDVDDVADVLERRHKSIDAAKGTPQLELDDED